MRPFPIIAAAAAYWMLGALWYSVFFAEVWSKGLAAQGIKLPAPSPGQLRAKLAQTFAANLVAATSLAGLLACVGTATLTPGLTVATLAGIGFGATSLAVAYTWEGKPFRVFLVDASYNAVGAMLAGLILILWQ